MLCVQSSLITYLGNFPLGVISTINELTVSNNTCYMPILSFNKQTCFPSELNFTCMIEISFPFNYFCLPFDHQTIPNFFYDMIIEPD